MINHQAFFEHLGEQELGSAEWHSAFSGLLVLRLFDAWVEFGPHVLTTDMHTRGTVQGQIDRMTPGDLSKNVLTSVLDAMYRTEIVDLATVGPRILAYGQSLDYKGQFNLAANVFRTVVAHAHPVENANLAVEANKQLGRMCRILTLWDEATDAYTMAGIIAHRTGDMFNVLWARIGDAKIALERGNLPRADEILADAANQAQVLQLDEIKKRATHERAIVAHRRGDFERAIRLGYEILEEQSDPVLKDRLLQDIAVFFADLGVRSAARDAHLILAATAQEQSVRWVSVINLMELAFLDGREPIFDQYRRDLENVSLSAELAVSYHYYVGCGYENFGHYELARESYERAIALARAGSFNQMAFQAESALASLGKKEREESSKRYVEQLSSEVSDIAKAIGRMRELAGVAGK